MIVGNGGEEGLKEDKEKEKGWKGEGKGVLKWIKFKLSGNGGE